jgi:plastocyanin
MSIPIPLAARGLALAAATAVVVAACSGAASPAASTASLAASVEASVAPSIAASTEASPSQAASAAPASAASGNAVTIQNFSFQPGTITVKVGTTVTWTNQDTIGHTVTLDDGSATSGTLEHGQTYNQTFSKAGTFAYHCKIHPSMTATVTVTG